MEENSADTSLGLRGIPKSMATSSRAQLSGQAYKMGRVGKRI